MTNEGQNGMQAQSIGATGETGEGSRMDANLAKGDRRESMVNNGQSNWAWANSRSSYDWMDSYYLLTDFA
jgi:hypothetical protein